MDTSKYSCPNCGQSSWRIHTTLWNCEQCDHVYSCVKGIPKLYLDDRLGQRDKDLRDYFYNGLLGTYYQHIMPFLSLPARPAKSNGKAWLTYGLIVAALIYLTAYLTMRLLLAQRPSSLTAIDAVVALLFFCICFFFYKHQYLFYLIVLAIPVKVSLFFTKFKATESFAEIHSGLIERFSGKEERLQILDISTGTCNSLYKHGWMSLNADYTGLDLSETMLLQGAELMAGRSVPMDFVLGDATQLPFETESFDIVLNYGAVNGFSDVKRALEEMSRVVKRGGIVLFLDEQLYSSASLVERLYFRLVLSSHNVVHRCPVELIPDNIEQIEVHQVYHFYYICTGLKKQH